VADIYHGATVRRYVGDATALWEVVDELHGRAMILLSAFEHEVVPWIIVRTEDRSELTFESVEAANKALIAGSYRPESIWAYGYTHRAEDILNHLWGSPLTIEIVGLFPEEWPTGTDLLIKTYGSDRSRVDSVAASINRAASLLGRDEAPLDPKAPASRARRFTKGLNNPWVVGIGVGLLTTVGGGLILALFGAG